MTSSPVTPSILDSICADKLSLVARQKQHISENILLDQCKSVEQPRKFFKKLQDKQKAKEVGLIAEVKKASPSKGVIREDFDPVFIAKSYEKAGASCISVLTDQPYFQGSDDYLKAIKENIALPILRKDFMLEPYQIVQSRAIGADAVLLIMDVLSNSQAIELEAIAADLGMDVLIEVHNKNELERALEHLQSPMIGINNRNLRTLDIDRDTVRVLSAHIPKDKLIICESGIRSKADLEAVQQLDIHCFLVGENLMKQPNIESATRELIA